MQQDINIGMENIEQPLQQNINIDNIKNMESTNDINQIIPG